MKSIRKFKMGLILILISCLMFLPGCWGKREVEGLAPLIGVGFDLGGKPGTFLITQQFAIPKKGGKSGDEIENRTVSVDASSGRESIEKIASVFFREPFMGSLKVIVIGEDLAKAGGFNDVLDFVQRFSEFRRSMYLVLAKGKAQDIMNLKLRAGTLPAMYIKDNIEVSLSSPKVRLGHYLTILGEKSTEPILPVVESLKPGEGGLEYKAEGTGTDEAQEIRLQGAGVFRKDHLVDFLTDEETKGFIWLDNQVKQRLLNTVGIDGSKVNFAGQVMKSTTKYSVKDNNGTKELQYQVKTSIAVDEVLGLKEQLSQPEWVALMKETEKQFAKMIQKECELSIKKEKALSLDFLGIGRHIEQKDPVYWKTVKDQWEEKIADFPVTVDVQVTIHNAGMSNSSPTTN